MSLIKSQKDIEVLRAGGRELGRILRALADMVKPGLSTADLEAECLARMEAIDGRPAFKGYQVGRKRFPTALCISINDEVVHGFSLPARILNEGDIVGIDVGMQWPMSPGKRGLYTDSALTVPVGRISKEAERLLAVTEAALAAAIRAVRPGARISDIGRTVQGIAEEAGFSVVRDLVGHGVGHAVHEPPQVFNYRIDEKSSENITLKPGMVIAIEPMINQGDWRVRCLPDQWTFATKDGSLSAHFEHTVAVTESGRLVITNRD